MRRLNKRIKKTVGMYGIISAERYKNFFKKEENKEKNTPKIPTVKPKSVPVKATVNNNSTLSQASFEKEYKDFIENLKKQKAEQDKAKAIATAAPSPVATPAPIIETSVEAPKSEPKIEDSVTELKTALDVISTEPVETLVEETRPRRRKRKNITDA